MKIIRIFKTILIGGKQCFVIAETEKSTPFSQDLKKTARETHRRAKYCLNRKDEDVRICFPIESEIQHCKSSFKLFLFSLSNKEIKEFWKYYTE